MSRASTILRKIMKDHGISQTELADKMGISTALLSAYLVRNNDIKVGKFEEFLEYLGYRMDIVPNDGIRRVSEECGSRIIVGDGPDGKYWYTENNGNYVGIEKHGQNVKFMKFRRKENCFDYLTGSNGN